jgi:hypothetical protein
VLAHLLELADQLRQAIELLRLRPLAAFIVLIGTDLLGLVPHFLFFVHAINLDNAWAVKSTMGTTRA